MDYDTRDILRDGCPNRVNGYCSPCKPDCPLYANGKCKEATP